MSDRTAVLASSFFILTMQVAALASPVVRIGSKNFTEQEILGELVAQLIEDGTSLSVERRFGLGGTDICHAALRSGDLDLYIEYTGTALLNVLKFDRIGNPTIAYRTVAEAYRNDLDIEWLPPLGFNNTYAITVRASAAREHDWRTISDLLTAEEPLRAGFTSEFMERPDGLPGLRATYGLEFDDAIDLDPGLMYEAASDGHVDVICAFATDGRIAEYGLVTLADDRHFFPPYDAAPIVRADVLHRHPEVREVLVPLAGTISDEDMRAMNHAVDVLGREPAAVARDWIRDRIGEADGATVATPSKERNRRTFVSYVADRSGLVLEKSLEHLMLTALGAAIAMVLGIPLGIVVHRVRWMRATVLALTETVQTIPSLAMLAILFAIYGVLGALPAVTALVLYALLPIVLNTFTGLQSVPPHLIEAANGVGMTSHQRLRLVELPIAAPVIVAGIRAAAVLTVGIATLSTYIGAGGLGDLIARGLARNDARLTLLGAIPAALMAVLLSLLIRVIERVVRRQ